MSERSESGLAYEVAGSGPAVLLFHEGIGDRSTWDPHWHSLSERFTAIRFDARGFGESADPAGPYTLHGDGAEILNAVGIERAALVGCSMGGGAALDLTLAAPHRVTALAIAGSTPSGWEHTREIHAQWEAVDAVFERDGAAAANELELRMWIDGVGRTEPADGRIRARVGALNAALLERQQHFEVDPGELEPPAIERLGEVAVPVLAMFGSHDQPSVIAGTRAVAAGTGAEVVEIAAAAHLPSLERPGEFESALMPFLERHAA